MQDSKRPPEVRLDSVSNYRKVTLIFTEKMILPENFTDMVNGSEGTKERALSTKEKS